MEKIKVMFVDDEAIVIEDLKSLINWEQYGLEIVAEAANGQKGLELYEKHQPDIIFVDIRMPVMDGLEFSHQILSNSKAVKVILLTAYRDFEYAKQALAIGVSDYLLKYSVNEETLIKVLKKIKNDIRLEKETTHSVLQNLVIGYINKRDINVKLTESDRMLFNRFGREFLLWAIKVDTPYPLVNCIETTQNISINKFLYNLNIPKIFTAIEVVELHNGLWIIIFFSNHSMQKIEVWQSLYLYATELQSTIKKEQNTTISVCTSTMTRAITELPCTCKRIINSMQYSIFLGREKVFDLEDIRIDVENLKIVLIDDIVDLEQALKKYDIQTVVKALDSLLDVIITPNWNIYLFNKVCLKLFNILEDYKRKNYLGTIDKSAANGKTFNCKWFSVRGIFEWFEEQFISVIAETKKKEQYKYSRHIQRACAYINEHYSWEISINDVAEELKISSVWLSKSFKKETGITFLEYLTEYRIVKAKELLKTGDYKIYEVAQKVGYKTGQYFSQVFQKSTGSNPIDFKSGKADSDEN